jgi:cell volume regulation protein A
MEISIIIILCTLLLLAYLFDISSSITKIPAVILLLLLGWVARQTLDLFEFEIPNLQQLLPLFGTIGLVLIVMEGALELELNKSKFPVLRKSLLIAVLPMLALTFIFAGLFYYMAQGSFKDCIINAIPFCVISSAIAIPSVRNLTSFNREFIVYESSLSDIFGVLFFNFMIQNSMINMFAFGRFSLQLLLIIIISFIAVLSLSILLGRIKHHITYSPIILLVLLIYGISKYFHLPGLLFILVFGLFLGNLDEIKNIKWINKFKPDKFDIEVKKFKEITFEATFIIRALFFILFGFLMNSEEIINLATLPWAIVIVSIILFIRFIFLKISGLPASPLLYVAPRGLITILLFLSILPSVRIPLVNNSLVIQTIVLSVLAMMFGLMGTKPNNISLHSEKENL